MRSSSASSSAPIVAVLVLSACLGGRDAPLDTPAGGYHDPADASTVVTLERTICFGVCPAYSLRIAGDGNVVYEGKHYVRVAGTAWGKIPVADVQNLVGQMMEADYFNLSVPEDCPEGIATDFPTATTSLTLAGQTHTVEHYHGNSCAPEVLRTIEDQIDATANSSQWVNCDTTDGTCGK